MQTLYLTIFEYNLNEQKQDEMTKLQTPTHAYAHWLVDVQLAGFAPAFTFSLCESESSRKSQDAHSLGRSHTY
jgi:hypothetical protein